MMFEYRDYERGDEDDKVRPQVTAMDCTEKDYSVVIMRCKDRPKLLFDTVCTLIYMQYLVLTLLHLSLLLWSCGVCSGGDPSSLGSHKQQNMATSSG